MDGKGARKEQEVGTVDFGDDSIYRRWHTRLTNGTRLRLAVSESTIGVTVWMLSLAPDIEQGLRYLVQTTDPREVLIVATCADDYERIRTFFAGNLPDLAHQWNAWAICPWSEPRGMGYEKLFFAAIVLEADGMPRLLENVTSKEWCEFGAVGELELWRTLAPFWLRTIGTPPSGCSRAYWRWVRSTTLLRGRAGSYKHRESGW